VTEDSTKPVDTGLSRRNLIRAAGVGALAIGLSGTALSTAMAVPGGADSYGACAAPAAGVRQDVHQSVRRRGRIAAARGHMDTDELTTRLRAFAIARDRQQFHTPKKLVMALIGKAGELAELFQWLTPEESTRVMDDPASAARVRHEMADVLSYLFRLADVLKIDIMSALAEKIDINDVKYPVELARGSAHKYNQLQ
jgi:NTP pyrophosphatase (non-canonical NTP hydrolase)